MFWGVALITSSIYHYCAVKQKEFSRKVEMSKVESFYWYKLSRKSFPFESDQFFDLCFDLAVHGGSTDNIQYIPLLCCKTKGMFQESKVEMSKVESLYWNKLSFKRFSFELEQFFNLCVLF